MKIVQIGSSCAAVAAASIVAAVFVPAAYASEVSFSETSRTVVQESASSAKPGTTTTENNSVPTPATTSVPAEFEDSSKTLAPISKILIRPPVQPKVTLKRVNFEGNTAISDEQLQALSGPFLNRPLRFSDLEQLRVEITRAYTSAGYINSGAVLPDQQLSDGELTYRIVEGKLDQIEVAGTGRLKRSYVAERVRAGTGAPFNSLKLRESFQLLLDDPLIARMDGQLLPMPKTGLTSLRLKVTPAEPWILNLTADNHGSPSVGVEQLGLAGSHLNLSGNGDRADISLNLSPGRYNLSGDYSVPLNARDTRLSVTLGFTNSTVIEEPLDGIDIESTSSSFSVTISHPLRRSSQGSLKVGADLSVRDNANTLLGVPFSFSAGEQDGESRVTALRVWQDYTRRQSDHVIALRSSFNFGLNGFGSTISIPDDFTFGVAEEDFPDSEYFAWLGQAQYVRSLQQGVGQLLLRANAQFASDALLPLERFALGGAGSVRGYRKNQMVSDQAVLASAEYRYTFHSSPERGNFQIAPFLDYGSGMNRDSDDDGNETLLSIGTGLLWSKSRYNAELYIGHALEEASGSADNNLQDSGIHFRFSTRLY